MNKVEQAIRRFRSTPRNETMFLEAEAELQLSEKMIDLRLAAGLTQKQLAERLGISQAYVAKLESGGYDKAGIGTLRGIALALGHDLAFDSMFVPQDALRYAARWVVRKRALRVRTESVRRISRTPF